MAASWRPLHAQSSRISGGLLWLASDRAKYVTGHVLAMDGGYTAM